VASVSKTAFIDLFIDPTNNPFDPGTSSIPEHYAEKYLSVDLLIREKSRYLNHTSAY